MLNTQEEVSTKKASEIKNQFSYTEMKMKQLDELISELETNLSPVLRVIPPKTSETEKGIEPLTLLAGKIKQIGDTIDIFGKRIRSILERTEL